MKKLNQRGVSYWAIIIVVAFVVVSIIVAFWPQEDLVDNNIDPFHVRALNSMKNRASDINEAAKIEKWIIDSGLNEYGDNINTLYAGGTPLFDEATGETMHRYEYIKMNHPDSPWDK